jgi:hypothetical protein
MPFGSVDAAKEEFSVTTVVSVATGDGSGEGLVSLGELLSPENMKVRMEALGLANAAGLEKDNADASRDKPRMSRNIVVVQIDREK